jgi:DUF4097 and DUF4098 domain-containing protein YvlB
MGRRSVVLALSLVAAPLGASAQSSVEQRRPAAADGIVSVDNAAGTIKVTGWEKAEVLVKGTLGAGATGLDLSGSSRKTNIEVEVEGNPHGVRSDLDIYVPVGSRLEIDAYQAEITVIGVKGGVNVETVNGGISITGPSKNVDAQSVNGAVEVVGAGSRVHAETVNGRVTVKDASGEVNASTVNGTLAVVGGVFETAHLETVSGSMRFEGSLSKSGSLSAEAVSGGIELVLPATLSADFSVSTFSGKVENELGPAAERTNKWTPGRELSFSTGSGGAKVSVETLSGSIRLRKKP